MQAIQQVMGPEEYECLVSLACGAAKSYRKSSIFNPFPKAFVVDGRERDYDRLVACLDTLPPSAAMFSPSGGAAASAVSEAEWQPTEDHRALCEFLVSECFKLRRVPVEEVRQHLPASSPGLHPDLVFEVRHDPSSRASQDFDGAREEFGCAVAFHGSSTENWFCIVNSGLRNFSGTARQRSGALFGEGIYLSSSLAVALDFSQAAPCWGHGTVLSSSLRVVGLCEVALHPDVLRQAAGDASTSGRRSRSVPDSYFVVGNSTHVRVKHLLVYTQAVRPGAAGPDRKCVG
eukprot:RCo048842